MFHDKTRSECFRAKIYIQFFFHSSNFMSLSAQQTFFFPISSKPSGELIESAPFFFLFFRRSLLNFNYERIVFQLFSWICVWISAYFSDSFHIFPLESSSKHDNGDVKNIMSKDDKLIFMGNNAMSEHRSSRTHVVFWLENVEKHTDNERRWTGKRFFPMSQ